MNPFKVRSRQNISDDEMEVKSANDTTIIPGIVVGRGRLMLMAAAMRDSSSTFGQNALVVRQPDEPRYHQFADTSSQDDSRRQPNVIINNFIYNNYCEGVGKEKNNEDEKVHEPAKCENEGTRGYEDIYLPRMQRPDQECYECGKRGHYGRDCDDRITRLMKDRNYNFKDPAQRNVFYLLQENFRLKEKLKARGKVIHDLECKVKTFEDKMDDAARIFNL